MLRIAGIIVLLTVFSPSPTVWGIDYPRDVKPILKQRCYACHGGLKQEAGLRLDTARAMHLGGDSGPAIKTAVPGESLLISRVTAKDDSERMPPEGEPLTAEQIARLSEWIAAGAIAPEDEAPEADPREYWAFRLPVRPSLPVVAQSETIHNPIDAFVVKERERLGLSAAPPAEKHVLLRRVYLDLIGLPPTRDELHDFLADRRADAYERVVDRLLASPQYGERWGRHWMDVWRYSDWYGRRNVPDVLNSYAQIWRWRDWIVRSLNEDKGYDRMVLEMLAADEIAPTDDENIVATGFVVRNFYRWNYNTWMKDSVEHTGKAFLALTLNCCHCHDHKYDPITQEEYFRFRAFFEPIEIRQDRAAGEPDPGVYPKYDYGKAYKPITSGMVRICDEKLDAETFMYSGGEERNIISGKPAVAPGGPAIIGGDKLVIESVELPPSAWYPGLKAFAREEEVALRQQSLDDATATLRKAQDLVENAARQVAESVAVSENEETDAAVSIAKQDLAAAELTQRVDEANVVRAEAELAAINARIRADQIRYEDAPGDADTAAKSASRAERQAALETARVEFARAERELVAAQRQAASDPSTAAEVPKAEQQVAATKTAVAKAESQLDVESTTYTLLSPQYPKQSTGRRTALARWIASPTNPLTARVAVNHIWARHFGRAIVETTDNFGRNGAAPTHPELLDWLATELMEHDWDMKHVHRLLVTSGTYRLSSAGRVSGSANLDRDRENIYLWRFNTSRMEAEVVRDSLLYVSGDLDATIGGKEIDQQQGLTTPRRSLYFEHHGEGRMQFLSLFDAASPNECYSRTTSIRPQQALAMTNSELIARQGQLLASKLETSMADGETGDAAFITAAFEQVLTRPPSGEELTASHVFLEKQRALVNSVEGENAAASRARVSFVQALFSHHDFVTIR